jgi:hypothetical protein
LTLSSSPAGKTAFSRRRAGSQASLPDWVWGAGLGVLVLIFVGAFFLVSGTLGGDGGGSRCDEELPALGPSDISAAGFTAEDAALTQVIDMLRAGDRAGAEAAFYGPTHNFTHGVDPPLREVDEDAARELCEAVYDLEESFISAPSPTVAADLELVRDLLRDAAESLGYPRPG